MSQRQRGQTLDWTVVGTFVRLGVVGTLAVGQLAHRLPQQFSSKLFAGLLFVMAAAMLVSIVVELTGGGRQSRHPPLFWAL